MKFCIEGEGTELISNCSNKERIVEKITINHSSFPSCDMFERIVIKKDNVLIKGFLVEGLPDLVEITITGGIIELCNVSIRNCEKLEKIEISGLTVRLDGFNHKDCPNLKDINISSTEEETKRSNCHFGRVFNGNPNVTIDGKEIDLDRFTKKASEYSYVKDYRQLAVRRG